MILTLGYFGYKTNQLDGQTVKTRALHELIARKIPDALWFDTQSFQHGRSSVLSLLRLLVRADKVFYLPARKNLKVLFPIIFILSKLLRFEIYYFVVGGWLPEFLVHRPLHRFLLARIKGVLTETEVMSRQLTELYGFKNTSVFYNFRQQAATPPKTRHRVDPAQIRLVFMSRINKRKGLEAIFKLADSLGSNVTIDFYGPIHEQDKAYFLENVKHHSKTKYLGVLEPTEIQSTLQNYDILLFPTEFYTEGLPGAIIDAYFAGLTVVASDWKHAREFIRHNETGVIFKWYEVDDFVSKVFELVQNPAQIEYLKGNVAKEAAKYTSEAAWRHIDMMLIQ